MENDASSLDVYDYLAHILEDTINLSWSKLGLRPDIISGKIDSNLSQAKVAIDVAAYLSGIIEDRLDPEDRRRVQGLVRDLRINYVQKSREGS